MDPVATYEAAREAVDHARRRRRPGAARVRDVPDARPRAERQERVHGPRRAVGREDRQRPGAPLPGVAASSEGQADEATLADIEARVAAEVDDAYEQADADPPADPGTGHRGRIRHAPPTDRSEPGEDAEPIGAAHLPRRHQPGPRPGDGRRRPGVRHGRGRGRLGRRRRVPPHRGPLDQARRGPGPQHPDLRGGDHRRRDRRGHRRDAPGARDHVHGLHRRLLRPARPTTPPSSATCRAAARRCR